MPASRVNSFRRHPRSALLGAASLTLTLALPGCGGGGSDTAHTATTAAPAAPVTPVAPVVLTTNVSTTVIDGPLKNVVVCLDKNGNGLCDTDEVKGTTDAAGKVTLAVPNADVGKYPILAVVGTDAVDADHGPVSVAYTMTAPADQTAVVSPLTTLVQQTVASTGASTADAAKTVQSATSLSASLFQDYTQVAAPTDGSISAATVARLLVVTNQQQAAAVAGAVNAKAVDGTTITRADLDKAVRNKLLELLPSLIAALGDPAVQAATGSAKETALLAAATTLVGSSGLSMASAPTVVAVNKAADLAAPAASSLAGTNVTLAALNYTSASSYYARMLTYSAAQLTPDASGMIRFVDRRLSMSGASLAKWGSGGSPARGADLHWNGKSWVGCPINFESTGKVRDANGNGASNYCDQLSVETSKRATFDIAGKTMSDVYAQARAAGYTNLSITDPSLLGSATFPAGSSVFYQTNNTLTTAIAYYPAGANSPIGTSSIANQYSAAVAAGGDASTQAKDAGCNSAETNKGASINATSLETWMAARRGTPCVYPQPSTVTYNGVTYQGDPVNEWWGNSVANIDKLGTVSLAPSASSTGYYTGNTLLKLAFSGTGTNPVTYLACKERFVNGSIRNCTKIGEGTYVITTLGDARVLSLTNPPAALAALNYDKVWVERGGFVYAGYHTKPVVGTSARLNTIAATALLTQLGVPVENPEVPLALTAASYQGTWDIRKSTDAVSDSIGTTVFMLAGGGASCQAKATGLNVPCGVTVTDPATGAFTYGDATGTASGSFNYLAGTVSGTYSDATTTPPTGSLMGGRR